MTNSFIVRQTLLASMLLVPLSLVQSGYAQMSGSRGGVFGTNAASDQAFEKLDAETAQSVVMVQGKSVMSLEPSEIRIVLALTFEGLTSSECQAGVKQKITQLRPMWIKAGVADGKIVEDFISILPRYEVENKENGRPRSGDGEKVWLCDANKYPPSRQK